MPNVIAQNRRSVTYLESRPIIDWMQAVANERGTNLAVILREATSAYYLRHQNGAQEQTLSSRRVATKVAQRAKTAASIADGTLSPAGAQRRNAPVDAPVQVLDLWPSIRRHVKKRSF